MLGLFVRQGIRVLSSSIDRDHLRVLTELAEAGDLIPPVDRTYALADVAVANDDLRAGRIRGKAVITP